MKNVISIDLEDWTHRPIVQPYIDKETICSTLEESVNDILKVFNGYNKRTTFFVLGEIAEKQPEIIERIYEEGHEIAYHGYAHTPLQKQTVASFREEIQKGKTIITRLIGEKPIGFRAPVFSLNNKTSWILPILIKQGFLYDSSIVPAWSPLYGSPEAPTRIYYPDLEIPTHENPNQNEIIEFPLAVAKLFGLKIPMAGGFYQRLFGNTIFLKNIKKINKTSPAMLYFHPWELCGFQNIEMPFYKKYFAYFRTRNLKNLAHIVKNLEFTTAKEILL
jgi:peptidoglycan-N-acetylglucosamine deacetylase